MQCVNSEHENGNIYQGAYDGVQIMVFEDVQEWHGSPLYYAWCGSWDDHDRARQTRSYRNMDSAIRQARNIAKRNRVERERGIEAANN